MWGHTQSIPDPRAPSLGHRNGLWMSRAVSGWALDGLWTSRVVSGWALDIHSSVWMGSGHPEVVWGCGGAATGPCCCHTAHTGVPGILLPAWHKPRQLHVPSAQFSSTGASMAAVRGSPLARLAQACVAGDHTLGTCPRHYREHRENTTATMPRCSCCRWALGGVSPRVLAQLCLCRALPALSNSSRRLRLPVPGGRGKKQLHSAQLRQPGSDHISHSVIQPGPASRDVLSRRLHGVAHVRPACITPGANSNEQPS